MNHTQYLKMESDIEAGGTCIAALAAILNDNGAGDTVQELYRSIYKHTDCGPWLSVKLHDGTRVHCDKLRGVKNGDVRALLVGSIVEGSDAEVCGEWIDLIQFEDPAEAVVVFLGEVERVNAVACELWEEANAEEEAAQHTPGPWEYKQPGCHAIVAGDKIIASAESNTPAEFFQDAIDFTLMAAAPELLAAAIEYTSNAKPGETGDDYAVRMDAAFNALRAAIAKATGSAA